MFMKDVPDGIKATVHGPPMTHERSLGFDVTMNVDIHVKLAIDLGTIPALAAAVWIVDRIRRVKIGLLPRLGKKPPKC